MQPFEDPNHEGNSKKYYTGEKCIVKNCQNEAGTAWGPYWCFSCNVKRIKRIDKSIESLINDLKG